MQGLAEGEYREAAFAQFRMGQHRGMPTAIVEHVFVDFVGEQGDRPIADQGGERVQDRRASATVQLGFCGLLMMISRVRSLKARADLIPIVTKRRGRQRHAYAAAARPGARRARRHHRRDRK